MSLPDVPAGLYRGLGCSSGRLFCFRCSIETPKLQEQAAFLIGAGPDETNSLFIADVVSGAFEEF